MQPFTSARRGCRGSCSGNDFLLPPKSLHLYTNTAAHPAPGSSHAHVGRAATTTCVKLLGIMQQAVQHAPSEGQDSPSVEQATPPPAQTSPPPGKLYLEDKCVGVCDIVCEQSSRYSVRGCLCERVFLVRHSFAQSFATCYQIWLLPYLKIPP